MHHALPSAREIAAWRDVHWNHQSIYVGEFWIFSGESYASVARNVSWMTFLLGTLAAVVGLVALAVRRLVVHAAASGPAR